MVEHTNSLAENQYGNYIIQHVIDIGPREVTDAVKHKMEGTYCVPNPPTHHYCARAYNHLLFSLPHTFFVFFYISVKIKNWQTFHSWVLCPGKGRVWPDRTGLGNIWLRNIFTRDFLDEYEGQVQGADQDRTDENPTLSGHSFDTIYNIYILDFVKKKFVMENVSNLSPLERASYQTCRLGKLEHGNTHRVIDRSFQQLW